MFQDSHAPTDQEDSTRYSGKLPPVSKAHEVRISQQVTLVVEPGAVCSADTFCNDYPELSIALDGRVSGPSFLDETRRIANVDHHSGVDRLRTKCTAAQVYEELQKDVFVDVFMQQGEPQFRIYVNDCDPDVCFAVWALVHADEIAQEQVPALGEKLFHIVDLLDRLGGIAAIDPNRTLVKQLAWINQPYEAARMNEQTSFSDLDGAAMATIICEVGNRIDAVLAGRGGEHTLDTTYDLLYEGNEWVMIQEHGFYARSCLHECKVPVFVSARPSKEDGSAVYSLGKINPRHSTNLESVYCILNAAEPAATSDENCWGGSDLIGGSPRASGSELAQDDLCRILDHWFAYAERFGDSLGSARSFVRHALPSIFPKH